MSAELNDEQRRLLAMIGDLVRQVPTSGGVRCTFVMVAPRAGAPVDRDGVIMDAALSAVGNCCVSCRHMVVHLAHMAMAPEDDDEDAQAAQAAACMTPH